MREHERLLRALGLCAKARALVTGVPMICDALKAKGKSVRGVLLASDVAENSAKRLRDRCAFYGAKLCVLPFGADALSNAIGKSGRVAAVAVTDENFWNLVSKTL